MILVHCEWDEWKIGECDKTCGGGVRMNTRIKKTEAKYGGEECTGSSKSFQYCNLQSCPGNSLLYVSFVGYLLLSIFEDFEMLA